MNKILIYSKIQDLEIKKYKNGYLLGLIGSNSTIRIFNATTIAFDRDGFMLILKTNLKYLFLNLYNIKFYNTLNNFKTQMQFLLQHMTLQVTTLLQRFAHKLWFKGRSFRINLMNILFINRGYVKLFKFLVPKIFDTALGKKQRYLRIRADSLEWLYQFIFLLQQRYKPNNYTGKGIRLKNMLLHKKSGKRKTY